MSELWLVGDQPVDLDASATLIVIGYAKVPRNTAARSTSDLLAISLLIDPGSSIVLEVDSTAGTSLMRRWLSALLVGADLSAGIDEILALIDTNYVGHAAGSIKQALADAWRRYAAHRTPREATKPL